MESGRPGRSWVRRAGLACVVLAACAAGVSYVSRPNTVWLRRDAAVDDAAKRGADRVRVVPGRGGRCEIATTAMIRAALEPVTPTTVAAPVLVVRAAPGPVVPGPASGTLPPFASYVLVHHSPGTILLRQGSPEGADVPAPEVVGLGMDGRELFLRDDATWRRLVARFAPGILPHSGVTRYVAGEMRVVDGTLWQAFDAASSDVQPWVVRVTFVE